MLLFTREQLAQKKLVELKEIAKGYSLKGFSTLKKSDLVDFIKRNEPSSFSTPITYIFNESIKMYSVLSLNLELPIRELVNLVKEHVNDKKFSCQVTNEKECKVLYRVGFRIKGYETLSEVDTIIKLNENRSIQLTANTTLKNIVTSQVVEEVEPVEVSDKLNENEKQVISARLGLTNNDVLDKSVFTINELKDADMIGIIHSTANKLTSEETNNIKPVNEWTNQERSDFKFYYQNILTNILEGFGTYSSIVDVIKNKYIEKVAYHSHIIEVEQSFELPDHEVPLNIFIERACKAENILREEHEQIIKNALENGFFVPENVLVDYAHLLNNNIETVEQVEESNNNDNLYWYSYTLRGFSLGCQPDKVITHNDNVGKHGIVAYDRPLTTQELSDYELKLYSSPESNNNDMEEVAATIAPTEEQITETTQEISYIAFNRSFSTYEEAYNYCIGSDFDPEYIEAVGYPIALQSPVTMDLQYFSSPIQPITYDTLHFNSYDPIKLSQYEWEQDVSKHVTKYNEWKDIDQITLDDILVLIKDNYNFWINVISNEPYYKKDCFLIDLTLTYINKPLTCYIPKEAYYKLTGKEC